MALTRDSKRKKEMVGDRGERREYGRRTLTLYVREIRPHRALRAVTNLSAGGMYIKTEVPYLAGAIAMFEISFAKGTRKVVTPARVVRYDEGEGVAFAFLAPHTEFLELLVE